MDTEHESNEKKTLNQSPEESKKHIRYFVSKIDKKLFSYEMMTV